MGANDKLDTSSKGATPATASPSSATPKPATGDGIRSIRTTSLFQIVNFELYAKPNMVVMGFGLLALGFSAAYLAYLKASLSGGKTYFAIGEDGTQTLMVKKSSWD